MHKPEVPLTPIISYSGSTLYELNKYIADILKTSVIDESNNAKNSTAFSNYIRNIPNEDDKVIISFNVTSLHTNIAAIDTLNRIKDNVNKYDQFTRKMAIPQDQFLDQLILF